MRFAVTHQEIVSLNIASADRAFSALQAAGLSNLLAAKIQFQIDWEGEAEDPRELSEVPAE